MTVRCLGMMVLLVSVVLVGGCGGSYSGVQAVVPGPAKNLARSAPDNGEYTLYRASGFDEIGRPSKIEKLWTISLNEGQRLGFQWVNDPAREYVPFGGADLRAFAGQETRDLGLYRSRDVQYLWAGSQANLGGYYQTESAGKMMKKATMQ